MSSPRVLCLSLLLAATTFACSSADAPAASGDPASPTPSGNDTPTIGSDEDAGTGSVGGNDDPGQDKVGSKTEGEPEIGKYTVQAVTKSNVFPTYLSSNIANLGHLIPSMEIKNPSDAAKRVIVKASLQGFTKSETPVTIDLKPGETKSIWMDAALDYQALSQLTSPATSSFSITLSSTSGSVIYSVDRPVTVLPKNTVFWRGVFQDSTFNGKLPDGSRERVAAVGSMTTPKDRDGLVDKLLQNASQRTKSKALDGYARIKSNTTVDQAAAIVNEQAKSIYDALHDMGMNYTSVSKDFFQQDTGQNIRFPGESLRANTANCIDGSLVFASAFEALGMNPVIVFVPGHAFVGVTLGAFGTPTYDSTIYIETTVVANWDYTKSTTYALDEFKKRDQASSLRVEIAAARKLGFLPFPM